MAQTKVMNEAWHRVRSRVPPVFPWCASDSRGLSKHCVLRWQGLLEPLHNSA